MMSSLLLAATSAENSAAAIVRGLAVPSVGASELLAVAQKTIGHFQQQVMLREAAILHDEDASKPLIAAARTLASVATNLKRLNAAPPDEVRSIYILAACAYAMYGNFPSAAATLAQEHVGTSFTDGEALALSICNPALASYFFSQQKTGAPIRAFLENYLAFLIEGIRPEVPLVSQFEALMIERRAIREQVYLRSCRLALAQIELLAVSRMRSLRASTIFHRFIARLIEDNKFALLPAQCRLLMQTDMFSAKGNALLSLPTSSGKTLLAEFALVDSLLDKEGISVYIVPYIALGNQVVAALRKHCPAEIDVHAAFGGYDADTPIISPGRRAILIATPERLDLMLRKTEFFGRLRLVVVDEAHLIENGVRGARLEGLLSRIRLKQRELPELRLLLVSAVLHDVKALIGWLGVDDRYYHDSWRPTARRVAIWRQDGILEWVHGNDALRPDDKRGLDRLGAKILTLPQGMYPPANFAQIATQRTSYAANVSFLARYLSKDLGDPILVVCMSKSNTRAVAAAIARELPERHDLSPETDAIYAYIDKDAPHLSRLKEMIRRGVCFHNSSLPAKLRGLIERAIRSRHISFVAATTTLAEGVDLPFRVSVVADWLIGFNDNERPMSSLLFRNIAGRCGRAGEFSEGDTVLFDNVLGSPQFTSSGVRERNLVQLFTDPPALRSAAFSEHQSVEERERAANAIAGQFMASVREFPEEDDLAKLYSASLYATYSGAAGAVTDLISRTRKELLRDDDGLPLAVAASPIALTPFGEAANRTGLSPATCRHIRAFLMSFAPKGSFWEFCSDIMIGLGGVPEQQNVFLRQFSHGSKPKRFFISVDDLPTLIHGYYSGEPLQNLFAALPKAIKSRSKTSVSDWRSGSDSSDFIEEQYDKFVDFVEYCFGNFLPWMLRSCGALSQFSSDWARGYDWSAAAVAVEKRERDRTVEDEATSSVPIS